MDNELFNLCKEVNQRFPQWVGKPGEHQWFNYDVTAMGGRNYEWRIEPYKLRFESQPVYPSVPLYTSDYLLEKLPAYLLSETSILRALELKKVKRTSKQDAYIARYFNHNFKTPYKAAADTPLKALLKLTIALDDAGVEL